MRGFERDAAGLRWKQVTFPFAASYACLCLAQGATVALPRREPLTAVARFRSRWWALIPLGSIVVVIFAIRAASHVADGLTYLALLTTPPLAALALAWLGRSRRTLLALSALPLFALAWAARSSLPGEAAGVILTALGCATLGTLLAAVTPPAWLKLGIVTMTVADVVLVIVQLLQRPNGQLDAAAPALGLPQFQRAQFGDALMGYGDLFIAAALGALLARERRGQRAAAIATALIALAFGVLFLWVNILPATVPVALALALSELRARHTVKAVASGRRAGRRPSARPGVEGGNP